MAAGTAELKNKLLTGGYKLTKQRLAVLEVVSQNREKHLSTEEILSEVKKKYQDIGLATVYRAVRLFERIGLVQHISFDDGRLRYQMADPEEKHEHHHLICEICGDVIDVQEDMLELLEKNVYLEKGFTVYNHRLTVFGICKNCSSKTAGREEE